MKTNKFKVGDKVRFIKVDSGDCDFLKVGMVGEIVNVDESDIPYNVKIEGLGKNWSRANQVVLADEWTEGDILIEEDGCRRKILGIAGLVYILSRADEFDHALSYYTKAELVNLGYKKEGEPEAVEELTMEEVCAQLGKTIKIKK